GPSISASNRTSVALPCPLSSRLPFTRTTMPTDNALSSAAVAPRTVKLALLVSNSTPLTNTLPNASTRPTATTGVSFEPVTPLAGEPPPPPPPPQPASHKPAAANVIHLHHRMLVSPFF